MPSPRLSRTALAAAVVAVVVASAAPASASAEDDLEAAQRRANQAARELADAQEELAVASDAVARLETRVARVEGDVAEVRDQVRELAVRLYVDGTAPLARLLRIADGDDVVRAQQYSRIVAGASTDALGRYRAEREDLRRELAALERQRGTRAGAFDNLRRRQTEASGELDRLTRVVEQARAAQEEERRARARATAAPPVTAPPVAARPALPPPRPTTAPAAAAAPAPAPAAAPSVGGGGWICPVQGPRAFSNDYGAPRPGGRRHQGNDILAARGTPVVANVSGVVTHRNGAVSGLAYYLAGDDGNRYFGAHLDSFGASGRVSAGTVIGTVGTTGDAAGGPPHLHFEIHPGGSGNVNPYPTLRRYC